MITIAYIIDTITTPSAGTEKQLLMLMNGLDRRRFRPVLVCLRNSDWMNTQTFEFPVEVIGLGSLMRPQFLSATARFKALHAKYHFDIAQTFFIDGNIFGTSAAHQAGIRKIVSSRRNIGYWHRGIDKWILRRLRSRTTHYLANSQSVIELAMKAEGLDPDKVTVIYNGLDLDRFRAITPEMRINQRKQWGIGDNETLVGAVANLRPVKNIPVLVDAMAHLKDKHPELRAVVIGEGDQREQLRRQIDAAGLTDTFLLPGAFDDVRSCLAAFDIGVLCSLSESFSNSLVEYMAAGLPVVASRVGGNVEAIQHGENGLLFDLDNPDSLSHTLDEHLSDPNRAKRLGQAARNSAFDRYSRETCLKQHEEFYEKIVTEGAGS